MAKITKYCLKAATPNEVEFEVTKVVKTISVTKTVRREDDQMNPLSARDKPIIEVTTTIEEGIMAVGLPSGEPAYVEILEVDNNSTSTMSTASPQQDARRPIAMSELISPNAARPPNINLTKALDQDASQPITLPKPGEITWAD